MEIFIMDLNKVIQERLDYLEKNDFFGMIDEGPIWDATKKFAGDTINKAKSVGQSMAGAAKQKYQQFNQKRQTRKVLKRYKGNRVAALIGGATGEW
jgi:hypothetical protein